MNKEQLRKLLEDALKSGIRPKQDAFIKEYIDNVLSAMSEGKDAMRTLSEQIRYNQMISGEQTVIQNLKNKGLIEPLSGEGEGEKVGLEIKAAKLYPYPSTELIGEITINKNEIEVTICDMQRKAYIAGIKENAGNKNLLLWNQLLIG